MTGRDPCDPVFAFVRCWEHDDCAEHPELAMACGSTVPPIAGVGDRLFVSVYGDIEMWPFGQVWAHEYASRDGSGDGVGNGERVYANTPAWRGDGWGSGGRVHIGDGKGVSSAFSHGPGIGHHGVPERGDGVGMPAIPGGEFVDTAGLGQQ